VAGKRALGMAAAQQTYRRTVRMNGEGEYGRIVKTKWNIGVDGNGGRPTSLHAPLSHTYTRPAALGGGGMKAENRNNNNSNEGKIRNIGGRK
jgi:hypothetical protein